MACNKPNCCRKAKAVESKMNMKATAELRESVARDLGEDDKSLSELLKENEDENDDTSTGDDDNPPA